MTNRVNLINKNQIVYIPAYVENGVEILEDSQALLEDISAKINRGISIINSSGYNRGIPYIEKGDVVNQVIEQMQNTISVITRELERYSKGEAILGDDAIIIADPVSAWRYGIKKDQIDYTLDQYFAEYGVSPKWSENFLTAAAGGIKYLGSDGRITKETWCDLDPSNLATLMRKQGIDLDFWIREDGVYMYGDYVMVAADIPHMDGTQQAAEYRKGDLVQTSLGTGMVVDLCGMAEMVRKGELRGTKEGDVEVWYDIYTAWHDGDKYQHVGYCNDQACISTHTTGPTMISESQTEGGQKALSVPLSLSTQLSSENSSITNTIANTLSKLSPPKVISSIATEVGLSQGTTDTNSTEVVNTPTAPVHTEQISNNASAETPVSNTPKTYNATSGEQTISQNIQTKTNTVEQKIKDYIFKNINSDNIEQIVNENTSFFNEPTEKNSIVTSKPETVITSQQNSNITSEEITLNNNTNQTPVITTESNSQPEINEKMNISTSLSEVVSEESKEPDAIYVREYEEGIDPSKDEKYVLPMINETQKSNPTNKKIDAAPFLAGLGLAAVASVGVKSYIDEKKEEEN